MNPSDLLFHRGLFTNFNCGTMAAICLLEFFRACYASFKRGSFVIPVSSRYVSRLTTMRKVENAVRENLSESRCHENRLFLVRGTSIIRKLFSSPCQDLHTCPFLQNWKRVNLHSSYISDTPLRAFKALAWRFQRRHERFLDPIVQVLEAFSRNLLA